MVTQFLSTLRAPLGCLVHLGAGSCSELAAYLEAGFEQIVLVEPNPKAMALLQRATAERDDVTLIAKAVSGASGSGVLNVFNVADKSALRAPSGLHDIYPGLKVVGEPDVDVIGLEALLKDLPALSDSKTNVLVIDTPGEELEIVQALVSVDAAQGFGHIRLHVGADPYFEGAATPDRVVQVLQDAAYQQVEADTQSDPDWHVYGFQFDQQSALNSQLREQVSELEARLAKITQDLTTARAEQAAQAHKHEAALKTRDAQLKRAKAELDTAQTAQATQAQEHDAVLAKRDQKLDSLSAELSTVRERLATQVAKHEATLKVRDEQAASLSAELTAVREVQAAQVAKHEAALKTRDEQVAEHEAALKTRDENLASVNAELAAVRSVQAAQVSKHESALRDRDAQLAAVTAELDTMRSAHQTVMVQQAAAQKTLEAQEAAVTTHKEQLATVRAELETAATQHAAALTARDEKLAAANAALTAAQAEQTAQAQRHESALNAAQQQAETLRRDLGVSVRMQAVAQADIKDLQQRFDRMVQEKSAQEALLVKVTQKLGTAAQQLQLAASDSAPARVGAKSTGRKRTKSSTAAKKAPKT